MRLLRLELIKILNQKRTHLGWPATGTRAADRDRRRRSGEAPTSRPRRSHLSSRTSARTACSLSSWCSTRGALFCCPSSPPWAAPPPWQARPRRKHPRPGLRVPCSRTGALLAKWAMAVLYALAGAAMVALVALVAGVAAFGLVSTGHPVGDDAPSAACPRADRRRLPAGGRRGGLRADDRTLDPRPSAA